MRASPSPEILAVLREFAATPAPESIEHERRMIDELCAPLDGLSGARVVSVDAGGVKATWTAYSEAPERTVMYLHGGAFTLASPWHYRGLLSHLARDANAEVLGVDYRLAPEHLYPAAHEDALTAYRWLLDQGHDPARLVIAGDSCGGTLTLAVAQRVRSEGLPLPAGLILISPWADLTNSGESYEFNAESDPWITKQDSDNTAVLYLNGTAQDDPSVSPLHGDLSGLPPMLIQTGGGEVLLTDSLELAEKVARSGGAVTLELWPHALHVWPLWASQLPEATEAISAMGRFAVDVTSEGRRPSEKS